MTSTSSLNRLNIMLTVEELLSDTLVPAALQFAQRTTEIIQSTALFIHTQGRIQDPEKGGVDNSRNSAHARLLLCACVVCAPQLTHAKCSTLGMRAIVRWPFSL